MGDSTVREIPSTLFSMDPEMEPMQGRRFESADKRIGASLVANQTLQTPPVVRHGRGRAVLGTRDEPARAADAREMGYERLAKRGKNASARKKVPEAERTRPERNGSRTERNDVGGRPGTRSKHPELSPLRVTFQFFDQMYPMETGTHRDFEGMDRPLLDQFNVTCPADAAACPDVIILSPAMAYALWKQNGSDFEV